MRALERERSLSRACRPFQEEIAHEREREGERFDDGFKRRWPSRARRLLEGRFDDSFCSFALSGHCESRNSKRDVW